MGKSWKQKKSQKSPWGPAAGIGRGAQTTITGSTAADGIEPTSEGVWPDRKGGGKFVSKNDQDLGGAPKSGYRGK